MTVGAGSEKRAEERELREEVALGCRVLGALGLGDLIWGHLSRRDPEGRGVWMKASTFGFEEIQAEHVLLVAHDGKVLAGNGRRHAEYPIHTEIMATRPDVNAVVHTHSPPAVALGATGRPLLALSHEATFFVPPDVPRFTGTSDLILTQELGRRLADSLGDASAALMVNHGMVVAAVDVPTAVVATLLLHRACEMQLAVLAAGEPVHGTSDAEALAKRDHCYPPPLIHQAWRYLVRALNV